MPEIALAAATLPAGTPAWKQEIIDLVAQYITAQFTDNAKIPNYGPDTPPPDRQDRKWDRTDPSGRPMGTWTFYNGMWVRDWGVPLGTMIPIKNMAAAAFDGTGKATDPQFIGWALCNGQNGTDDLRERFVLAYKDASTPESSTGGAKEVTLTAGQIPQLAPADRYFVTKNAGTEPDHIGDLNQGIVPNSYRNFVTASLGQANPTAVSIMPPYIVKAWIQFIGYV